MRSRIGLLVILAIVWSGTAVAHSKAPALLELRLGSDGLVIARLKQNLAMEVPEPDFPPMCRVSQSVPSQRESDGVWSEWQLDCGGGLPEGAIGWSELSAEVNVVLRLIAGDGQNRTILLHHNNPFHLLSGEPAAIEQFRQAVGSGVSHLFAGFDHLLFIIGLVLYLGRTRALIAAASLFTVGHSLTLALVTLGTLSVPVALAELAIAGSILYLATSLFRTRRRQVERGWKDILLMPLGFGLLHGLGFANVLESAGLRSGDLLINLLGFNLGIELGQLVFIGSILMLYGASRWFGVEPKWRATVATALIFVMGNAAAYWWWERMLALIV
ncbi:hypothetical protein D777_01638 [Marinobacter nitratireducens]|uniref:HupE/UreJ family protein n=1 Tax=Marinobacter nitratireducens TaxID=1137280 RepID=A0A072N0T3_9GAMM|nr:HupE/UreJ family protein [Marinobacter nitratireducens]KEF31289.1 hypothetical protein D777_01638 [Marinobacter nitratireducens]